MMKLLNIVGARPQFVKIAPFCRAVAEHNRANPGAIENIIAHTGQHYDAGMSDVFFDELQLPRATVNLGVGSGSHGRQTGLMLERLETLLLEVEPDVVIVYGDTNSTLAGTLAAAKLHLPVAHVEAGLRSFNRDMPEEINRIVADHTADLLLAPTPTAMKNLTAEGLSGRAVFTGDIMYDAVSQYRELAMRRSAIFARLGIESDAYGVVTVHRAENTDGDTLGDLLQALNSVAEHHLPLIFPVHPRTKHALQTRFGNWRPHGGLTMIEPLGYLDLIRLVANARMVLTDSGGLQKEAFFLSCPCITLRNETEWVETVHENANIIAGTVKEHIVSAVSQWEHRRRKQAIDFSAGVARTFGDGRSAQRILRALMRLHDGEGAGVSTPARLAG